MWHEALAHDSPADRLMSAEAMLAATNSRIPAAIRFLPTLRSVVTVAALGIGRVRPGRLYPLVARR